MENAKFTVTEVTWTLSGNADVYQYHLLASLSFSIRMFQVRPLYTEYAGWAVTAGIPVKFGTAHGRSRPEVGSGFPIEAYGNRGVSRPSLVIGNT